MVFGHVRREVIGETAMKKPATHALDSTKVSVSLSLECSA
jgi:hypothetical protein